MSTLLRSWLGLGDAPSIRRTTTRFSALRMSFGPEHLESRQLLSAIHSTGTVADVNTVGSTVSEYDSTNSRAADSPTPPQLRIEPAYPHVAGTWALDAAADIDDDPTLNFSGTVRLEQQGRKIGGTVDLNGLPTFKIKGKLDKSETFELNGKTRFPVEMSEDRFFFIRGQLSVNFSQGVTTFTGQVHRVIFGHHIDIALSATRQ